MGHQKFFALRLCFTRGFTQQKEKGLHKFSTVPEGEKHAGKKAAAYSNASQ
jgi:hypothetical protein